MNRLENEVRGLKGLPAFFLPSKVNWKRDFLGHSNLENQETLPSPGSVCEACCINLLCINHVVKEINVFVYSCIIQEHWEKQKAIYADVYKSHEILEYDQNVHGLIFFSLLIMLPISSEAELDELYLGFNDHP